MYLVRYSVCFDVYRTKLLQGISKTVIDLRSALDRSIFNPHKSYVLRVIKTRGRLYKNGIKVNYD